MRYEASKPFIDSSQVLFNIAKTLALAACAACGGMDFSEASMPGGRLSCDATPGVSHTPNGVVLAIVCSCMVCCCALMSAESVLTRIVASEATATAWTTKRVLFNREDPRGSMSSGMLPSAVTYEV